MKFYLLLFTVVAGMSFQTQGLNKAWVLSTPVHIHQNETVYICDSEGATKYHSKNNCRGLNNCKADIVPMDKKDAIKLGRDECGWCY